MKRYLIWVFLGAVAFAQRSTTNITANNQCAQIGVAANSSSTVTIQVSGTWTATLQAQVSAAGRAATNINVTPKGSTTSQATITTNGFFNADGSGVDLFQVCTTAYTSGTAVIDLTVTTGIATNLFGGGGSGAVSSVFGRTGAVTATSGDYTAAQVTNAVANNTTNIFTSGLQDLSSVTMELPESAGFVSTVDSTIGIDTNTGIEHLWGPGSADSFNVVTSSTSTTTTNVLHATATAGLYAPSAITAGDLPTTLTSGTAITNAALTTPTLGTPASGTLTNATGLPLNGVVGATAANTITETAVLRPTTFAGVETSNLTYPYVFQNTNSTNSNTSGALLANCAGTDAFPTCVMVNGPNSGGILLSLVTGGTVTNGVISGQTQQWTVNGAGTVIQAGSQTIAAGSAGVASLIFAGDSAGAGMFRAGTTIYGFSGATNEFMRFGPLGVRGTNASAYGMTASATSSSGNYDTCMSRSAAGVAAFDTNSACNDELALIRAGNPCRVTADAAISVSGTAVTMCQWSLPAVAKAWAWQCQVLWTITAGTTPTISIGVNASQTPTGTTNTGAEIITSLANLAVEGSASISASGAVNVLTSGTLTPAATLFQAQTFGTLLASATAGTFTITMTGTGTSVAGAIKAGTTCSFY